MKILKSSESASGIVPRFCTYRFACLTLPATLVIGMSMLVSGVSAQNLPSVGSKVQGNRRSVPSALPQPVAPVTVPEPAPEQAAAPVPEPVVSKPAKVTYEGGQLTVVADNSTLADIMTEVQKVMGAEIEVPPSAATEHYWVVAGPGPARKVLAALLNESKLDYLIVASTVDPNGIKSVSLTPRSESSNSTTVSASAGSRSSNPVSQSIRDSNRRIQQYNSAATETRADDPPAAEPPPAPAVSADAAAPPVDPGPGTARGASANQQAANADVSAATSSSSGGSTTDQMMRMLQNMYEERKQQMQQIQKNP